MGTKQSSVLASQIQKSNQSIFTTLLRQNKGQNSLIAKNILNSKDYLHRLSLSMFVNLTTNNILVRQYEQDIKDQQESESELQSDNLPKVKFQELVQDCKQYKIKISIAQIKKTIITNYFQDQANMQNFVSNLIKLKQKDIQVFEEFETVNYQSFYLVERSYCQAINLSKKISRQNLKTNQALLYSFFSFLASIYHKISNIILSPSDIYIQEGSFKLINFGCSQLSNIQILRWTIFWVFDKNQRAFEECMQLKQLNTQQMTDYPIYLKQLLKNMNNQKISQCQIYHYVQRLRLKAFSLNNNIDSLNACLFYKKTVAFEQHTHSWLFAKKQNQLYFYNIDDKHNSQVKLVRKKKRIDISTLRLIFDPQELDIKYIAENSKLVVHANQFQLQSFSSISDIQIKYKLPVKFKNPFIFNKPQKNELIIFQNYVYRFNVQENKIFQQSKKISDCIFLCKNKEQTYMIIKTSMDIFKNGIRIFFNNQDIELTMIASLLQLEELKNIRIDIRHVQFCKEVYKKVYLLLANKNLWILDLNFNVFFSFSTIQRIKQFYGFGISSQNKDYAFQILNQPFKVQFLINQQGNNVKIKNSNLHLIGQMSGNYYYFKYELFPEAGSLKLLNYTPIFGSISKDKEECLKSSINQIQTSKINQMNQKLQNDQNLPRELQKKSFEYKFNFHQQNLSFYKQEKWFFEGQLFLTPKDFSLHQNKTNFQISLQVEEVKTTLKNIIQSMKKQNRGFNRIQMLMLLVKFLTIFQWLVKNKLIHKNISVNNLYITQENTLKLIGWSQSSRNWFVSDYKDLLLVFFNVITINTFEKLTQKILQKYSSVLSAYPLVYQKMCIAFKSAKTAQKKGQVQRQIASLKQYGLKQLSVEYQQVKQSQFMFNFQYNTPRLTMIFLMDKPKIKKIKVILDQNSKEEIVFRNSDKYIWKQNQKQSNGSLFIFTTNYNFYQIKINYQSFKEQTLICQQYQYLPNNILDSTVVHISKQPYSGIYSFGGVFKGKNTSSDISFCNSIYKFNSVKLTWDQLGVLPEAKINPKIVVSKDQQKIYIMGGEVQYHSDLLRIIKFNLKNNSSQCMIDSLISNPFKQISNDYPYKIFNLSEQFNVFLIVSISQEKYQVRIFSCTTFGFDIMLQTRNFSDQNKTISNLGITLSSNNLHILRQYGKYTKLQINKLESLIMTSQTFYPDRQQN